VFGIPQNGFSIAEIHLIENISAKSAGALSK